MAPKNIVDEMSPLYEGREQTYIKHCVLERYLASWAMKRGSVGKFAGRTARLWYVDTHAGPWKSKGEQYEDTSIAISLRTLRQAYDRLTIDGARVEFGAIFVEKDPSAFKELQSYLSEQKLPFKTYAMPNSFESNLDRILELVGTDPAFCFVDPTGWVGADMYLLKKLIAGRDRDVLVNFMFDFVNRFKDHDTMETFFGAKPDPNLDENGLMKFYRQQLKDQCGLAYAADLIVRDPIKDRTKFRLVVGGDHPAVLELFRAVENKVIHESQEHLRVVAKEKAREQESGQGMLLAPLDAVAQDQLLNFKAKELERLRLELPTYFKKLGHTRFLDYWTEILQEFHISKQDLKELLTELRADELAVYRLSQGKRALDDDSEIISISEKLVPERLKQTAFALE